MDLEEIEIVENLQKFAMETSTQEKEHNNTESKSYQNNHLFVAKIVVQTVILTLAIFGNTCLFIVLRRRKRNFTRMHVFITHLCFADMLVAFFNILPQLIWEIVGEWKAGDMMCRFVKFMQIYVMYLSTYVLVLTALDRRRAICSPLLSHTWTYKLVHLSVGAVYILCAFLSLPQAIIFKYQETQPGSGQKNCWVHFKPEWTLQVYITTFTVLVYVLPLIILIYAYGSIYYTIFIRQKQSKRDFSKKDKVNSKEDPVIGNNRAPIRRFNVSSLSNCKSSKTSRQCMVPRSNSFAGFTRAKMKTVKLTLVIIIAYIACWSPFFISQLWWLYDESAPSSHSALVIMILLASLNSCCNPWIYMAFSGSISVRVLTSCFPCYGNRSTYDNRTTKDSHENQRMLPRVQSVLTTLSPTPSTSSRLIVPNLITVESSSI
ncbi:cephalotocin receptor 2-like [Ruditapes philippinarum]|uniref:cephalotocin receptor 2-like n=1 Tax=Ruditapes philippinarum TaxID=129788 RepID=UPI00295B5028|nr:cephalotocin receptor 2-like [Ruditapes philippinarum]